jgi:hypothetical protein
MRGRLTSKALRTVEKCSSGSLLFYNFYLFAVPGWLAGLAKPSSAFSSLWEQGGGLHNQRLLSAMVGYDSAKKRLKPRPPEH